MGKLLLINPSYANLHKQAEAIVPPLGLACIASYLKQNGLEVEIVDCTPLDIGKEGLKKILLNKMPNFVGISSTTPVIKEAIEVSKIVKEIDRSTFVIMGGPHVTALAKETLEYSDTIDCIVCGEGEATMLELMQELQKKSPSLINLKGITYKENGKIYTNEARLLIENIDQLPFPSRELLPMTKYRPSIKWYYRMPFATMITSRGCPFKCIFCDSHLTFGRKTRFRSANSVIKEIQSLAEEYGIKEIIFYDDTFTLNKSRTHEICDLILEKNIDITWGCLSRVDTIDKPLLQKMKRAGCHMISFGVESGSERMLEIMQKGVRLSEAEEALKLAKDVGIDTTATFVIGIPGETRETLRETINFARKIEPTYAEFFRAVPFPGTKLYHDYIEQKKPPNSSWEDFIETDSLPLLKLENLKEGEFKEMFKKAYRSFYLRPLKLLQLMLKLSSIHKIKGYLRAFKTFLRLS